MGEKFQIKNKAHRKKVSNKRQEKTEGKDEERNNREPLFCFKYLDLKVSLKGCDNITFKHFLTRIQKLSILTWEEINKSDKHQYGFEKIPRKQIRPKKFPPIVTDDMNELIAFRYTGDNKPFICIIQTGIIFPIFIEANFGDVYEHG